MILKSLRVNIYELLQTPLYPSESDMSPYKNTQDSFSIENDTESSSDANIWKCEENYDIRSHENDSYNEASADDVQRFGVKGEDKVFRESDMVD